MIYSGGTIFAAEMAISEMAESTQVFEFLPVTARYAKVAITSNHGHTSFAGISELHFEYTPVDCGGCDLDNDHDVDLDDLKILAQNWLSIN